MSKQGNIFVGIALGVSLFWGCAHQTEDASTGHFSDPNYPPTSSRSTPRVYGTTTATAPGGGLATLTITNAEASAGGAAPAGPAERELIEEVRNLLIVDKNLVPHPSQVTATLHPEEKGTVVLSGTVLNEQTKKGVIDRVASLPGVTRVEDRMELNRPKDPGTVKPSDIVPQK